MERTAGSVSATAKRGGGNRRGTKAGFGSVRRLPSKRYQARFTGPDGLEHKAPTTFETKADAQAWLAMESAAITERRWKPRLPDREPGEPLTFRQYASSWLEARELKPRTRDEYRKLLGLPRDGAGVIRQPAKSAVTLLDEFGDSTLEAIVPQAVRSWHRGLGAATPTRRAHLYALLRTVLGSAVEDEIIATNPCQIRGAGKAKRVRRIEPATLEELRIIVAAVPERWAMLVELAAWCALRFGEATELRRKDVSKDGSVLCRRTRKNAQ